MHLFYTIKQTNIRLGEAMQQTEHKHQPNRQASRKQTKQHRNTGYPALDPTANKYLSGSGWEISVFFSLCFYVFLFSFCLFGFMCFFDCKCKSLKRLCENRTKHKETYKQKHNNSNKNKQNEIQDFQPTNLRKK